MPDLEKRQLVEKDRVGFHRTGYPLGTVTGIDRDREDFTFYGVHWDDDVESWHRRESLVWVSSPEAQAAPAPEPPTVEQAVEFFGGPFTEVESQLRAEWKRQADLVPDGQGIQSGSTIDCLRLGANEIARLAAQVERLAESLRLTQEYVGDDLLPPKPGWEWYDALVAVGKDPRKA